MTLTIHKKKSRHWLEISRGKYCTSRKLLPYTHKEKIHTLIPIKRTSIKNRMAKSATSPQSTVLFALLLSLNSIRKVLTMQDFLLFFLPCYLLLKQSRLIQYERDTLTILGSVISPSHSWSQLINALLVNCRRHTNINWQQLVR